MIIRIIGRFVINLFSKGSVVVKVEWNAFKADLEQYKQHMYLVWLARKLKKETQESFDKRFKFKKVYAKRKYEQ